MAQGRTGVRPDGRQRQHLGIRTGLAQPDPTESREMVHALTRADAVTGGPEATPSL